MVQEITPKKNPFFAGPQTGARPQPRPMQPRPIPGRPVQLMQRPSSAGQNKKVFMVAGIIIAVIVVGVILYFLWGTFGGELATKL